MTTSPPKPVLTITFSSAPPQTRRLRNSANLFIPVTVGSWSDPLSRGLGIGVTFPTLPDSLRLNLAQHSIVIALIDDDLVVNAAWADKLNSIWESVKSGSEHRLIPVKLSTNAYRVGLKNANFHRFEKDDITGFERVCDLEIARSLPCLREQCAANADISESRKTRRRGHRNDPQEFHS